MGLYRRDIGVILGIYWDNGKENGNYHLGFRVCRGMLRVKGVKVSVVGLN